MHGSPLVNSFEGHISRIKHQREEQKFQLHNTHEEQVSKSLLPKSIHFCQKKDPHTVKTTGQ